MFNHLFTNPRMWPTRLALAIGLAACLVWLSLLIFRGAGVPLARPQVVETTSAAEVGGEQQATSAVRTDAPQKLEGEQARVYLEQTSDGQSLMQALTVARFGLQWQERAPFGVETGGGYLGMSHDQNLNAWFDEGGATIRPTVAEKERRRAWQLGLRLKGYGYGERLQAAPPVVARNVKDERCCQCAFVVCSDLASDFWWQSVKQFLVQRAVIVPRIHVAGNVRRIHVHT